MALAEEIIQTLVFPISIELLGVILEKKIQVNFSERYLAYFAQLHEILHQISSIFLEFFLSHLSQFYNFLIDMGIVIFKQFLKLILVKNHSVYISGRFEKVFSFLLKNNFFFPYVCSRLQNTET